ncbi:MAG: hypothetical protein K0R90_1728, partial [Oscillospiraceae bacterium]|nr:hypothetical protein [Oscillospiraceae bacterium]
NSIAIIGNGDITDNSLDDPSFPGISVAKANAEYDMLNSIVNNNKDGLPPLIYAVGNHDLRGGDGYTAQLQRFLSKTGTTDTNGKAYYYKEINGAKFIVLGSEHTGENEYNNAELSQQQLTWFENTLKEHSKLREPIFVFLHQPLKNTTAGTTGGFQWHGVNQDAKVREILKKYPQAVWFSGHTHWELESNSNMFTGYGKDFSAFNDGGVGKLYTDNDKDKEGSQGLFVEVYKDKILVKGRDFENKLWVTSAQFMIDTTLPSVEKVKEWTKDNATTLTNQSDILSLYNELSELGTDKGSFNDVFTLVSSAKDFLNSIDDIVKTLREDLDILKQQTKENTVNKELLDTAINNLAKLTTEQKALLPDSQEIVSSAQNNYNKNEEAKKRNITAFKLIDSKGNQYPCIINQSNISVTLPYGSSVKEMKLVITPNAIDARIAINGVAYNKEIKYNLSSPVQIKVTSPAGEKYGSDYKLTVSVQKPKNGWEQSGNKWYYYQNDIKQKNKWIKSSNKWYYTDSSGIMATSWKKISGKWYYFDASGSMATNWKKISGKWYFFASTGEMKIGWQKISSKWYYFQSSGEMIANTSKRIANKIYKFNKSGVCLI